MTVIVITKWCIDTVHRYMELFTDNVMIYPGGPYTVASAWRPHAERLLRKTDPDYPLLNTLPPPAA